MRILRRGKIRESSRLLIEFLRTTSTTPAAWYEAGTRWATREEGCIFRAPA
jgi:hypothetical protein